MSNIPIRLKEVHLKGFKRFTDLTVTNLPENARLIMLVGPNGCGKSSFFDALNSYDSRQVLSAENERDYYVKPVKTSTNANRVTDLIQIQFHNNILPTKAMYFRSAYRNEPRFILGEITQGLGNNFFSQKRVKRMSDNNMTITKNYKYIVGQNMDDLYNEDNINRKKTIEEFIDENIGKINIPLNKILPDLKLTSFDNPLRDGKFRFTKGIAKKFSIDNLSGGEKAVFDLLLDIIVALNEYKSTIFGIDEPELHINSRVQGKLLEVLYNLIPLNCQLMIATHSIGMARKAQQIENENPGSVVFLDFGKRPDSNERDFDEPEIIKPVKPTRLFWESLYKVALDDLGELLAPDSVVICEGEPIKNKPEGKQGFDAACYNIIFEQEFPRVKFISGGGASEVNGDEFVLSRTLGLIIKGMEVKRLIDRDDRSPSQIKDYNKEGVRVLSLRNIETYLFDDEVLEALAEQENKTDKLDELFNCKSELIKNSKRQGDDLKLISGQLYIACKDIFDLHGCGNDSRAFMRDTLAPLIKPDMEIYKKLEKDIFG